MVDQEKIAVAHLGNIQLSEEIENAVQSLHAMQAEQANDSDFDDDNRNDNHNPQSDNPCPLDMFSSDNLNVEIEESNEPCGSVEEQVMTENDADYLQSIQTDLPTVTDYSKERLNKDQRRVFDIVLRNAKVKNPQCLFVTGPGGTGKSYLIHCICQYLTKECSVIHGVSPVLKAGPTGICSKNIFGVTLHSLLKLPLDFVRKKSHRAMSASTLKEVRNKFIGVTHLIIDEISMVSSVMLNVIHQQLCLIKKNENFFGGLCVLAFGDFYQLKPVKGYYAFKSQLLWPLFEPYFLTESVRHSSDLQFSNLCKNMRLGQLTREDMILLKTRLVDARKPPFESATHIFPKREQVILFNKMEQVKLQHKTGRKALVIKAEDSYSCGCSSHGSVVDQKHIPSDDRDCGGLPKSLSVCVGTKVILIKNLMTSDGLVNGADGVVTNFDYDPDGQLTIIYVTFDDPGTAPNLQKKGKNNVSLPETVCI